MRALVDQVARLVVDHGRRAIGLVASGPEEDESRIWGLPRSGDVQLRRLERDGGVGPVRPVGCDGMVNERCSEEDAEV